MTFLILQYGGTAAAHNGDGKDLIGNSDVHDGVAIFNIILHLLTR